jgi:hypothetical protein
MSLEVYLLSIPLARHRSIVPRHRGHDAFFGDAPARTPDQRSPALTRRSVERSMASSQRQRLDHD